jgi:hypothetical protein
MFSVRMIGVVVGTMAAGTVLAQPAQKVTGPVATYWVSAQTQSGIGMPMGGGRPDREAMMRMMMGGRGGAQHLLTLQLGSERKPQGAPSAEHLPPAGLSVGPSLPLVTPQAEPSQPAEREEEPVPRDFQKPHGRMLIFWGCGEHARPGQPLVIDFSKLAPGQMPPGFAAMMRGFAAQRMQPPSPGRSATYGEWPNAQSPAGVPPQGSLVGDHTVRGDYTPEIHFTLRPDQDFLAPVTLTSNARIPSGAVQLAWNPVGGATGYFAGVIGGAEDTMVAWSSSETQASPFAAADYIAPAEAARLVASGALLAPRTTSCAVPKEVVDAAPHAMLSVTAYGPEANFASPPRPADPKTPWNRLWAVKVRYRSTTGGLLGMAMPGAMRGAEADEGDERGAPGAPPPRKEDRKRSIMRGLGGALGVPVPGL